MARFQVWILSGLALIAFCGTLLRAQVTDEEKQKRDEFLKARGDNSATPGETPKAKAKSSPHKHSKSKPEKSPSPKAVKRASDKTSRSSKADEAPTPAKSPSPKKKKSSTTKAKEKSAKKKSGSKKETPAKSKHKTKEEPEPSKTPKPSPTPDTRAALPARPVASPQPAAPPALKAVPSVDSAAQLTIEKSGFEQTNELAPAPSPPPRRFGFWPWSRPREASYHYLSRSVIDEIRRAPVMSNRWKFIVVHNSGTRQGNAKVFDYYHRHVRRMQNGLAYHFVIGNGTSTGNGQVEVGDRWRRQINGGHVHSDFLNNIALGICLVGDFNRDQPTPAQLDACEELIRYLRQRCGKADGRNIPVRPHREMNPPRWATDCPGDAFPYSWFRRF